MSHSIRPLRMEDAVHLVRGVSAAGCLKAAGARDIILLEGTPCPGPCHVDPTRHLRKRRSYILASLEGYNGPDYKRLKQHLTSYAKGMRSGPRLLKEISQLGKPAVIWTAWTFPDLLTFWWALNAVEQSSSRSDLWYAQPRLPGVRARQYMGLGIGAFPPKAFSFGFSRSGLITRKLVRAGAALWRKYGTPSPLAFDRGRREGSALFPDFRRVAEVYGTLFPILKKRGLHLSQFDQALFAGLDTECWRRPVDVFKSQTKLVNWIVFGDLLIPGCLREWAATPALMTRPAAKALSGWTAVSYRLTEFGANLRDNGIRNLNDVPNLIVGGCHVNSWMRCGDRHRWWIEKIRMTGG